MRVPAGEETPAGKRVEIFPGAAPVARAVLEPSDCRRIGLAQTLDQRDLELDRRELRDVVEIDAQPRIADALDELGETAVESFLAAPLEEEGRQGENAGAALLHRMRGELDRVGEGGAAAAGHERSGRHAGGDHRLERSLALANRE